MVIYIYICLLLYYMKGLEALKEHFKNSKFPCEMDHYLPVVFSPPRDGRQLTEPLPIVGQNKQLVPIGHPLPYPLDDIDDDEMDGQDDREEASEDADDDDDDDDDNDVGDDSEDVEEQQQQHQLLMGDNSQNGGVIGDDGDDKDS